VSGGRARWGGSASPGSLGSLGSQGSIRWGFHRLDEAWAARLVAAAQVRPGELVLDLGAGDGVITSRLLATGARVIAVELHGERARALQARFVDRPVTVVHADLATLRLPRQPFVVVANPPFDHGARLVRALTAPGSRLNRAELVLPRRTIARQSARPGFVLTESMRLPRSAFTPRPSVDVAVLRIRRR
jgi:23S rRNA (adenine-N6)-dimethyltransferase